MRIKLLTTIMLSFQSPRPSLSQSPAAVYLSQLAPGSRCIMKQSLNAIAHMITGGTHDAFTFEWHQLRYQHTAAIRSALMERHSPATVNKMIAALKRCLKECQRLGLMNAEDYAAATDLKGYHYIFTTTSLFTWSERSTIGVEPRYCYPRSLRMRLTRH